LKFKGWAISDQKRLARPNVMKYGKKGLPVQFPDGIKATIIRKKTILPVSNPEGALKKFSVGLNRETFEKV
jgi:hypothetical protein